MKNQNMPLTWLACFALVLIDSIELVLPWGQPAKWKSDFKYQEVNERLTKDSLGQDNDKWLGEAMQRQLFKCKTLQLLLEGPGFLIFLKFYFVKQKLIKETLLWWNFCFLLFAKLNLLGFFGTFSPRLLLRKTQTFFFCCFWKSCKKEKL